MCLTNEEYQFGNETEASLAILSLNDFYINGQILKIAVKNPKEILQFIKKLLDKNYKIIEGFLTYIPEFCPCCGAINFSHNDIIKQYADEIFLMDNGILKSGN